MLGLLDRCFVRIRAIGVLYRFTLLTRLLLAAGFIPTGMVKVLGQRFTTISPQTPIGAFFEAMFQTGLYWRFIGLCQVVAGVLVLVPRLAHLGAAIFLGIILNIFVITVSLEFRGTWAITGLMLMAALYLCAWDYHRFRPMLAASPRGFELPVHRLDPWERLGFWTFGVCVLAFFVGTRGLVPVGLSPVLVLVGTLAGVLTAGRFFVRAWLGRRRGDEASTSGGAA